MEALPSLGSRRHGSRYIYHDCLKHRGDLKQVLGWRRDGGVPPHLHPPTQPTAPTSGRGCPPRRHLPVCFLSASHPPSSAESKRLFDRLCRTRDGLEVLLLHGQLRLRPPGAQSAKSASPKLAF